MEKGRNEIFHRREEWIATSAGPHDCSPLSPTSVAGTADRMRKALDRPCEDESQEEPLCSVLNTVIDFVMKPPTALEFDDFLEQRELEQRQTGGNGARSPTTTSAVSDAANDSRNKESPSKPSLLVPVIRVFGPILRRQSQADGVHHPPVQSACLHIHGAFPYLLARPRVAGPDGSLHQKMQETEFSYSRQQHLDWDDPDAVERFIPLLKTNLEESIQAAQSSWGNNGTANNNERNTTTSRNEIPKVFVIRRLSVVMGRGFYTYCPGPPAPFVRVEYYNPSDRWKVKRALEKGLDSLPLFYHPDPLQYDPFGRTPRQEHPELSPVHDEAGRGEMPETLQFHCYEAHIPYTMQFFKDWNLAGMSYIHVGRKAMFRLPLPLSNRKNDNCPAMESGHRMRSGIPNECLFLQSNTSVDLLWPGEHTSQQSQCMIEEIELSGSSFNSPVAPQSSLGQFPMQQTRLNSSNQSSFIDSDGSDRKSTPRVRHRPLEKETSCDVELDISVDQILNVLDVLKELPEDKQERQRIHWRAVPSLREIWKQERLRMSRLLTPGNDFLSGTQEQNPPPLTLSVKGKDTPMPGTQLAVEGMKRLLRVSDGLEENYARAMKQIVQRYSEKVDWIDERLKQQLQATSSGQTVLTPTFDEAVTALRGLASDNEESEDEVVMVTESAMSQQLSQSSLVDLNFDSRVKFDESTEMYYNPSKRGISQEPADDYIFSQLVDQGESVVQGPFANIDDFIDPETLRPFETIEDDGDSVLDGDSSRNDPHLSQEELMEKELSVMATQTLELGNEPHADCKKTSSATDDVSSGQETDGCAAEYDLNSISSEDIMFGGVSKSRRSDAPTKPFSPARSGSDLPVPSGTEPRNAKLPPVRKDVLSTGISTALLPLPPKKKTPNWMKHMAVYSAERKSARGATKHGWFSGRVNRGGYASLTRCPPSRRQVVSWLSKQSQKRKKEISPLPRKKAKSESRRVGAKDNDHLSSLAIDGNPRKLVVQEHNTGDDGADDKIYGKQVEEVEWCSSQQMSQSETPQVGKIRKDKDEEKMNNCLEDRKHSHQSSPTQESLRDELLSSSISRTTPISETAVDQEALGGIGQQGGKLWVEGGGRLKAQTKPSNGAGDGYLPTPLTVMSIEVHVQCRTGRAGVNDSKQIAMVPDSDKDPVAAVVFVVALDPGAGETLQIIVSAKTS